MQFKDFDAEVEDVAPVAEFKLGGRTWHCRNPEQVLLGRIQALRVDAKQAAKKGADGDGEEVSSLIDLVEACLVPEEGKDFRAVLNDPTSPVTLGKFWAVLDYVLEAVWGRPTTPPADSSNGQKKTGRSSKGGSSSRVTRRSA